jgi:hypothetical protein
VYLASSLDAALWSYAYPYQRRLFIRALDWAARTTPSVRVHAPMCVQSTFWRQEDRAGSRVVVQLFNINTTAGHGLPSAEVPLREEVLPIHDIRVVFAHRPRSAHQEPGGKPLKVVRGTSGWVATVPRLDLHTIIVAEVLLIGEFALFCAIQTAELWTVVDKNELAEQRGLPPLT